MVNRYIIVPLVVWAIAQFLKFSIAAFRGRVDFRYLYGSGGMPSVHAAVVTSLAVTALLVDGINSGLFGLSAIFAAIVMYDSFGVRRSTGEQAIAINQIIDSLEKDRLDHPQLRAREILGHKPLEVSVGAVLGLFLGALLNSDKLGPLISVLTLSVGRGLAIIVAVVAVLILAAGLYFRFAHHRRYRKEVPVVRSTTSVIAWWLAITGIIGLFLAFIEYERVVTAVWLIWPIIYVIFVIVVKGTLYLRYRGVMVEAIGLHLGGKAKARWLEGPNKKRRKAARSRRR